MGGAKGERVGEKERAREERERERERQEKREGQRATGKLAAQREDTTALSLLER